MKHLIQFTGLILLTIMSHFSSGQFSVTPGVGFDNIQIGMTYKSLKKVLGKPETETTKEVERAAWESGGYDTNREFPFQFEFDKVLSFSSNKYLLWKVHMFNDRVTYINLSSYQEDEEKAKKISVNNQIHFYDSWESIKAIMGEPYITKVREGAHELYIYPTKGISFIIDEGVLRNIFIYAPLISAEAIELSKKIAD